VLDKKILIVEDDSLVQDFLKETLQRLNIGVETASSGEEAFEKMSNTTFDVVLSDIRMPTISGMEVLKRVKETTPDTKVVMMTAFGTVENAVEAMKLGAFDYVMKPFSADEIEIIVKKALDYQRLIEENKRLRSQLAGRYKYENIVGKSPGMQKVFEQIQVVSDSKATVLITGDTGTGKELVATAIHFNSNRRDYPFIRINCAAIPEGLIEAELFGFEKGAFTGAIRKTAGRFEIAHGGTLLLDEISEISSNLQGKLLRVLQEREFERLGSGETIQVDVRIVATTNKNLAAETKKGNFREDLFYRLNVFPIHLPVLKDRKEDIPALVEHFIKKYSAESNKHISGVSEEVLALLLDYPWPGNVRELENYIERAVVVAKNKILSPAEFPRELTLPVESAQEDLQVGQSLENLERNLILKTLASYDNNQTKAADVLGISTRTLRNKLKEYGLK